MHFESANPSHLKVHGFFAQRAATLKHAQQGVTKLSSFNESYHDMCGMQQEGVAALIFIHSSLSRIENCR